MKRLGLVLALFFVAALVLPAVVQAEVKSGGFQWRQETGNYLLPFPPANQSTSGLTANESYYVRESTITLRTRWDAAPIGQFNIELDAAFGPSLKGSVRAIENGQVWTFPDGSALITRWEDRSDGRVDFRKSVVCRGIEEERGAGFGYTLEDFMNRFYVRLASQVISSGWMKYSTKSGVYVQPLCN